MPNEPEFDSPSISFFVEGIPAPGGSKNAFAIKRGGVYTGRVAVVDAGGQKNKNWRARVRVEGLRNRPAELLTGPVTVAMHFVVPRPKSHRAKDGTLRKGFPSLPVGKPDVLKLARSTEDALTGVIWKDDSATCFLSISKRYSSSDCPGCYITITKI